MFQLELNLHNLDREIEALRAAVADKINPTKLVETRLEMRNRRPVLELVQVITTRSIPDVSLIQQILATNCYFAFQDKPMRGLIEEFERVHLSSQRLEKKLEDAL